jgi:hypothetical protein
MTGFDLDELAALGPAGVARVLKHTPASTLSTIMSGDHRGEILDAIFATMPSLFRPERAGATSAVIHWHLTGRPDGGRDSYQLVIEDRTCTTAPLAGQDDPAARQPSLAVTMGAVEFLQLISGASNPAMMFLTGKIRATGDYALAAGFASLFDVPRG